MATSGDGPDIPQLIGQVRRSLSVRKDEDDYITPQPVSGVKLPTFAGDSVSLPHIECIRVRVLVLLGIAFDSR